VKVFEYINQLKGTNASIDTIKDWSYNNRIPPCSLQEGLELEAEYPKVLTDKTNEICKQVEMDCYKCLDVFFESEITI
jgi:hypothetical protein